VSVVNKMGTVWRSDCPLCQEFDHNHPFRVLHNPDQPLQVSQVTGAPLTLTVAQAMSRGLLPRGNASTVDGCEDERTKKLPPMNTHRGHNSEQKRSSTLIALVA